MYSSAPSIVVYDNACGLHTYCLKRDPHFFKETRFLVDRFHWNNHTGMILTRRFILYVGMSLLLQLVVWDTTLITIQHYQIWTVKSMSKLTLDSKIWSLSCPTWRRWTFSTILSCICGTKIINWCPPFNWKLFNAIPHYSCMSRIHCYTYYQCCILMRLHACNYVHVIACMMWWCMVQWNWGEIWNHPVMLINSLKCPLIAIQ